MEDGNGSCVCPFCFDWHFMSRGVGGSKMRSLLMSTAGPYSNFLVGLLRSKVHT